MKLTLKNISIVRNAEIEINGVTVIGGENNTGKSTVSRCLYAVLNGMYNYHDRVRLDRYKSVSSAVRAVFRNIYAPDSGMPASSVIDEIAKEIIEKDIFYEEAAAEHFDDLFSYYVPQFKEYADRYSAIEAQFERIRSRIRISEQEVFTASLNMLLKNELSSQLLNVYSEGDGEIQFQILDQLTTVHIFKSGISKIVNAQELHTQAVYIDDPFILDDISGFAPMRRRMRGSELIAYSSHRDQLVLALYFEQQKHNITDELVIGHKLDDINSKLSGVCGGSLVKKNGGGYAYFDAETNHTFEIPSLSTGLKTFVLFQRLLQNGALEESGTVILDEPEIHLHPEWQLVFAELIVLLHKELGMNILLNTHSPYFLRAIQVYAAKHAVADKCRYYLAQKEGSSAVIHDVSDDIESIYELLAEPFQKLEDLRWQDDDWTSPTPCGCLTATGAISSVKSSRWITAPGPRS